MSSEQPHIAPVSAALPEQALVKHVAPRATGYTLEEIEQLASSIAARLGYEPGNDIAPVIKRLGGEFRYLDTEDYFFRADCERLVVDGPGRFTISLHKLGGLFNNRFAIAHELGHYFLHSEMGKIAIHANNSAERSAEEWEATVFAAAFLMPRARMTLLNERKLSVYDLSACFLVSPEAVTRWRRMITPSKVA
jgi:hypothetical protein